MFRSGYRERGEIPGKQKNFFKNPKMKEGFFGNG